MHASSVGEPGSSVAVSRVRATRRLLIVAILARALAWGIAVAIVIVAIAALADLLIGLALPLRSAVRWIAPAAGILAAVIILWLSREVRSLESVALWVEERVPRLRYALVTAVDDRHAASRLVLEPRVRETRWGDAIAKRAVRAVVPALMIALGAWAILLLLPDGAVARVRAPAEGDALDRAAIGRTDADVSLAPLIAEVIPPAYTRERTRTIEEPSSIAAPVGSRVVLRGRGSASSIEATLGDRPLAPTAEGERWALPLTMTERPGVVRLRRGDAVRLVALEPRADSAPVVTLSLPARDSVLATGRGRLMLAAEARDDYGLARVAFEYIVTSGEGEQFTFRQGTLGARAAGEERRAEARAELALDSLALGPGDVVHIRAVATDLNTVSGPSVGVSETRAIRIARVGERDTITIAGAPPPEPDRAALSQRMLIMLTEALVARVPTLERAQVIAESRTLARDQARLRRLVGEIIFTRLGDDAGGEHAHGPGDGHDHTEAELETLFRPESLLAAADRATGGRGLPEALDFAHGESPVLAVNRPLLTAYNHMWDAGSELEIGEPARALPPMRLALDALQEARAAERYFMRGRPPAIVVDIDRVRLAARQPVTPAPRRSGAGSGPEGGAARFAPRYAAAVELLDVQPAAAIDSLLLLRIEALGDAPALATALEQAITALRSGSDATAALLGARRAIEGGAPRAAPLGQWSGGW